MDLNVKICGLTTPTALTAAIDAGATHVGFVFYGKSPRHISVEEAQRLASLVPETVKKVALIVDAADSVIAEIVRAVKPDILQAHGSESPERIAEIRARFEIPVMKAVKLGDAADLDVVPAYEAVADILLFDARPPEGASLPGGNGIAFDWTLLTRYKPTKPWMLSGGLTPENVAEAVRLTGALAVDVSSGVEAAPGTKSPELIARFLKACEVR